MADPITTADGERIQADEDLAVEALQSVSLYRGNSDDDGEHLHELDLCEDEARAILAAIRAGKVPGVCLSPDIAIATAYQCAEDALASERDQLRSEVERLTKELEEEQKRVIAVMVCHAVLGDEWLGEQLDAEKRPAWADAVELVRKLKGERDAEKDRAEKAESRHAEAVALLREARSDLRYLNALPGEHGQDDGLLERINSHLAACDKAPAQDSGETATRKCPACGDPVLHRLSPGLGWIPIQYHDCKMEKQ